MAITGYLAEFSLADLFKFLEQGNKTGLLSICPLSDASDRKNHYIWLRQGRIVAAAAALDHQELIRQIGQRGWLGELAASRLGQNCTLGMPLGVCLKTQGALSVEQLKMLFYTQVMRQVCDLFTLKDGWFQFDHRTTIPETEMTGLSAPATEVTLVGLRALKDWSALADKLPDPTSALTSAVEGKPSLKLNQAEWQIWEFSNGTMALQDIAKQLQQPVDKIQQIAFRLITIGIAEEIPMVIETPLPTQDAELLKEKSAQETNAISQSFFQNLVGFLKGKI
ncbi:MAG TPA: DUF4388 domain-containing protein [Chroococcidiopsis sp.]